MCPLLSLCCCCQPSRQTPRHVASDDSELPWSGGGRVGAGWSSASVCAALLCSRLWHVDSTHVCWVHGELVSFFGSAAQLTNCCGNTRNARLAQSAERKALNLVVVGSSPTVGAAFAQQPQRARSEIQATQKQTDTRKERAQAQPSDECFPSDAAARARAKLNETQL